MTSVLRSDLVERLRVTGAIVSAPVEAAFRAVPREHFMPPGTAPQTAYGSENVVTKRDPAGTAISSVTAADVQAAMLEQADLRPGMSVLEVGSGGLNAALIAEIVGPGGRVVSVDIDPSVTARAAQMLAGAGYGDRVTVLTADGDDDVPGPFDAIIVTVGAWDIAPAWHRQLTAGGTLVVPLVMNGATRTIAFRRETDHLVSTSARVAGFVAMQGHGRHDDSLVDLGDGVTLRFDGSPPPGPLTGVLATGPVEAWSGVLFPDPMSWSDLYLWLAWQLPGFCRLTVGEGSPLDRHARLFPVGTVHERGLALIRVRPADRGVEFGALAFGRDAAPAAAVLVEQMRAWNRHARPAGEPSFGYWPAGSDRTTIPPDAAVLAKTHGLLTMRTRR
ncbi:hypothetical protein GCM10010172_80620 [Paractinoplanes ferrugineus]|uniref:Protein-L-isoaspartate O-methyltransferase n=1 Tax=Paractinoplanes ferrugineus TaxID=113564 RepID=A0A919MC50_9ACTN|nr:methyltransferase, FxLD system [Actinoplanes ferrugineus]GIE10383.1 hypothetical protein Afe05nite_22230 [Actinoplanes ferrugineus]